MEDKEKEERESLLIRGGKGALKSGLWGLEKYGQGIDWANDQVNLRTLQRSVNPWLQIPGASEAVEKYEPEWVSNIMDYSYKDLRDDISSGVGQFTENLTGSETAGGVAEFGSQVLLPDITDVKTGGIPVGAIPRVAKKISKFDLKTADKFIDWVLDESNSLLNRLTNPNWRLRPANNVPLDDLNKGNVFFSKTNEGLGKSKKVSGQGFTNITKNNLKLFNQIGWTDTAKLDIQEMLYGVNEAGKPILSNYKRRLLKASIADPGFDFRHFKEHRPEIVKDFLEGLQDLNIDPKTIHAHHVSGLRVTSSLFDGLSPIQRKKLIRIFQEEGLALGNDPKNLIALHSSSHLGVLHPFLEKQIGKYGQLLIDPKKIKNMSPKAREEIVRRFAKIIKKSEAIAMEHSRKWLDEQFLNMSPEAAFRAKMDMLEQAFDNEVAFRELVLKDIKLPKRISKDVKLNKALKQVEKDLLKGDINSPKQLSIWDINEESLNILRDLMKQK